MRSFSLLASILLSFSAAAAPGQTAANGQKEESTQPAEGQPNEPADGQPAEPPEGQPNQTAVVSETLEQPSVLEAEKPNEIISGPITFSGAAIEAYKTDNLFQLINPAAPESYGYAEDNVVRDPINGKVSGIKLFSVKF